MKKIAMTNSSPFNFCSDFRFMKALRFLLFGMIVLTGCKKEGEAILNVYLVDGPVLGIDEVNIDIQSVEVNHSSKDIEKGWKPLTMNVSGAYNLLEYVNGKDTLIATGTFSPRELSQLRLIPGPDNGVVDNGKTYTLSITSLLSEGIRLPMSVEMKDDQVYNVYVEIDVSRSLERKPNNQYILEPAARTFMMENTGSVSGTLSPASDSLYVFLAAGNDTIGSVPAESGKFIIRGVTPGTWLFTVIGPKEDDISIVEGVTVTARETKELGIINLK